MSVIGLIPKLPLLLNPRWTEVRLPKRCFMTEFPSKTAPHPPSSTWFSNKVDDPRSILPDVASPARTHSFGDDGRTLGFHILCLFKSGLGSPGASLAMYCPPATRILLIVIAGYKFYCSRIQGEKTRHVETINIIRETQAGPPWTWEDAPCWRLQP